jgi:hypothetical protein
MMDTLKHWKEVLFTKVKIQDHFWRPYLDTHKKITLPICLNQCEKTGRISNFAVAGGLVNGKFQGIYYDDSDVYKVLEGAAYALMSEHDPELEHEIDRIIDLIAAAQEDDGYLSTYFTLVEPEMKWTNMERHEMYNGGHLIEAAVAYYEATGKRKLLEVAIKIADHYDQIFGPGKRHWVEGHEEIELALIKLYRVTQEERYWKLCLWLLEERGHGHGKGTIWDREEWGPAYCQDDIPVREIRKVTGHAVRAMYLYAAMADVVHVSSDPAFIEALNHVWEHTVSKNMYITGGIGPSLHNEGFTHDYDLPNESAYCETCASIAMVLWNHRMNLLFEDAKYADIVEREIYNGALAGISLSGDKFFYVNPLASKGEHHRVEWFGTSCCPTNLARFLPSIGTYVYGQSNEGIVVNQYINGMTTIEVGNEQVPVQLKQQTLYPWDGSISIDIVPAKSIEFEMKLRIPGWCRGYQLFVNDKQVLDANSRTNQGYVSIDRQWNSDDTIRLVLDMPVNIVRSRAEVTMNQDRLVLQRGPIVYCLEQVDNPLSTYDSITFSPEQPINVQYIRELLNGVVVLNGQDAEGNTCTFIPYYAWDNREAGFMQVWIKEQESKSLYRY